jgi:hypothetical protein
MRPITGGLCSICGERLLSPFAFSVEGHASETGDVLCGLCRRLEPPYVKATAYGSYDSGLRELIHLLKYNQVRPAANVLGRMLMEAVEDLKPLFTASEVLVVPVPLHSEATSAGIQPIGINCSRWVEAELRQVPTDRGFVGTAARDEVSDRTLAAPASGKYSRRVRRGKSWRSRWT